MVSSWDGRRLDPHQALLGYVIARKEKAGFRCFRLVEARRRNAVAEARLNRRLAGDVYLAVVPLTVGPGGRLAIGGAGRRRIGSSR